MRTNKITYSSLCARTTAIPYPGTKPVPKNDLRFCKKKLSLPLGRNTTRKLLLFFLLGPT